MTEDKETPFKIEAKVVVVESLSTGGVVNSSIVDLRLLHCLLSREWKVRIHHIPRAHIKTADHMIKYVNYDFMSLYLFEKSSLSIQKLLANYNSPSRV